MTTECHVDVRLPRRAGATSGALLDPREALAPDPGVPVVDAGDPLQPQRAANFAAASMLIGTWESFKVNELRKLLGGVAVGALGGAAFFDVYDVAHPFISTRSAAPGRSAGQHARLEGNWRRTA